MFFYTNIGAAPAVLLFAALAVSPAVAKEPAAPAGLVQQGSYVVDGPGRRFRTRFDPGNRMPFESAWAVRSASFESFAHDAELGLSIRFRGGCEGGGEDCWKRWHRLFEVHTIAGSNTETGWPVMSAMLLSGRYVRYLDSPYISLPTATPRKVFMPFNFGFSIEAGGVNIPDAERSALDVQVVDAKVIFALWRTPKLASSLHLGVGFDYDIQVADRPNGDTTEHLLAPFTATSLAFHHETSNGFHLFDVELEAAPTWSDLRGWGTSAGARARYELIILAVNDQPVSFFADASYRSSGLPVTGDEVVSEFRSLAGLALSLNL